MSGTAPTAWFTRLCRKIASDPSDIVWIRALPGTGKSSLLARLREDDSHTRTPRIIWDEPNSVEALALLERELGSLDPRTGGRLLLLSRPSAVLDRLLLKSRAYGRVSVIGDADLFLTPDECRALDRDGGESLYRLTGGWPFLVGAHLNGRDPEIRALLPEFLNTDAFPSLSHSMVVALLAAAEDSLPAAAARELLGDGEHPHPLLRAADSGFRIASSWVEDGVLKLKAMPTVWLRATTDALVSIHSRYGNPTRAIMSLNRMGQRRSAYDIYQQAHAFYLGFEEGFGALKSLLDSFPTGLEEQMDGLLFGRVMELIAAGRTAAAFAKLDAHYPGLPVDLRLMRYSHRPYAILIRLLIQADLSQGLNTDQVESWSQLEALLDPEDRIGCALLQRTISIALARVGAAKEAEAHARRALAVCDTTRASLLQRLIRLDLVHLALGRGDLKLARKELAAIEAPAGPVHAALKACFSYEEGTLPPTTDPWSLISAVSDGDSWPSLFLSMVRASTLITFWQSGLTSALDHLAEAANALKRRHGMIDDRDIAVLRIRFLQIGRRHSEATREFEALALRPAGSRGAGVEESLIEVRVLAARGRGSAALSVAKRLAELPDLSLRQRLGAGILLSHLLLQAGEAAAARRQLGLVLRDASSENLRGALYEDSEFLERPLGLLLAENKGGPDGIRTFGEVIARAQRKLHITAGYAKQLAGLTHHEHRVLLQLSDGQSNKEIARVLEITESGVKYHLRTLFQKFGVKTRSQLIDAARQRGVIR